MSSSARSLYRQYSSSHSVSSENLPPRTLARVARELRNLHKSPPEGVRLVADDDDTLSNGNLEQVLCEIEGPVETPYEGKFFVLKLVFSQDFPAAPPRGFFLTKIYHPNVDMQTGAICVNTLKKDWKSETSLSHVLSVIRCLLIVPFPESSLNDEAGKLFMESYEDYSKRAALMAHVHGRTHNFENKQSEHTQGKSSGGDDEGEAADEGSQHSSSSSSQPTTNSHDPAASSSSPTNKSSSSTTNVKKTTKVVKVAGTTKKGPSGAPLRSSSNKKIIKKSSAATSAAASAKLARKKSLKRL